VFAIGLLRRFLNPILDPLAFVPNTFYTHHLSKYGLFQSLSQYGLFQNPSLHTCFGLNLNRVFSQNQCFCVQTLFKKQRAVLHKNSSLSTNTMLYTTSPCSCWAWLARAKKKQLKMDPFHGDSPTLIIFPTSMGLLSLTFTPKHHIVGDISQLYIYLYI
jgi:hypothetical protein